MNFKKLILLFLFLHYLSFSQEGNYSNGFFTFNAGVNFNYHSLGGLLTNLEVPKYGTQPPYYGPYITFKDEKRNNNPYVSAGAELIYNFSRETFFGFSFGVAHSYVKDFYNYTYSLQDYQNSKTIVETGKGELLNQMLRFVYSFNLTSKKQFSFYFRPLNPELRFIQNKNANATHTEYDVIYSKIHPQGASGSSYSKDSIQTVANQYQTPIVFPRSFSICFPTTIGFEQKFKFKKLRLNAGLNCGLSILELYIVPRAYLGVCFGDFKQP